MQQNLFVAKTLFDDARRITTDDSKWWYVANDYGPCCNYCSHSDRDPRQHDRSMADPHIILNNNTPCIAAGRIPDRLSHHVIAMIISTNECDVSSEQNTISNLCIAMNNAVWAKLNSIPQGDPPVGRPQFDAPGNSNHTMPNDPIAL